MKPTNMFMAQLMRGSQSTSPVFVNAQAAVVAKTVRGGGGSWHKPDPKPPQLYKYTRRYHLQDINSVMYHDFAPEFHMHLHSMWVQSSKQGIALLAAYTFLVIMPILGIGRWLMKSMGPTIWPSVRAGP